MEQPPTSIETKKFDDYWLPGLHNVNNLQRTLITLHGTLYSAADSSRYDGRDGGKVQSSESMSTSAQELLVSLSALQQNYDRYAHSAEERVLLARLRNAVQEYIPQYKRALMLARANAHANASQNTADGDGGASKSDSALAALASANEAFSRLLALTRDAVKPLPSGMGI